MIFKVCYPFKKQIPEGEEVQILTEGTDVDYIPASRYRCETWSPHLLIYPENNNVNVLNCNFTEIYKHSIDIVRVMILTNF